MSSDLYLTEEQEQHIIDAIAEAERRTSGEIRIHIERHCEGDPLDRACRIFHELGMDDTELQNGILIYVASIGHKAAIYAGKGIHQQVEDGFWNDVLNHLIEEFSHEQFETGIAEAVRQIGTKLKELFPYHSEDTNELKNDISYYDDEEEE